MSAKVQIDWSMDADCEKCGESIDLTLQDEDGCFSTPIFKNRWGELKGETFYCEKCDHETEIDEVVY